MKPAGAVVGIVVVILWFLGATLIAAPSSVINMIIPPSLGLGTREIQFIAISTFLVSAILIALYTSLSKEETIDANASKIS
jgi:branched-subunit amino acid permease